MARYTVELRSLLNDPNTKALIEKALSTYPMYEPLSDNAEVRAIIPTREALNDKLLKHYKYREIGFETVGRFLEELELAMNEIMPYYNQRLNTVEIMALIDDPFGNVDVTETFKETREGNEKINASGNTTEKNSSTAKTSDETTATSHAKNVESETPQSVLNIPAKDIDSVGYADKVGWAESLGENSGNSSSEGSSEGETNSTNESNSDRTETVEHTFTKKGNQGVNTYAHDMIEFRESIIDVTMEIIEDVKIRELFMQVF